jgi:hypothetical protein
VVLKKARRAKAYKGNINQKERWCTGDKLADPLNHNQDKKQKDAQMLSMPSETCHNSIVNNACIP